MGKQYAMHSEEEKTEILNNIQNMEHLKDGFGTFQGTFNKNYQNKLARAPLTETLVRAVQDRVDLELKGLAPPPKKFSEFSSSTVVRTGNDEGVCRISDEGMICENPFRAEHHVADSLVRRRTRRKMNNQRRRMLQLGLMLQLLQQQNQRTHPESTLAVESVSKTKKTLKQILTLV